MTARAINWYTRSRQGASENKVMDLDERSDSHKIFAVYFVSSCFRVLVCQN